MNFEAHPEKRVPGGWAGRRAFKAVLIYENFAAGVCARWFCKRLACALDRPLEEKMWNFDVLMIREVRNAAAGAARKSDLLIVSVSGRAELPCTIRAWFDMWLWLLDEDKPALVALFSSSALRNAAPIRAYLSTIARCNGIDFFPHEVTSPVRQESVPALRSSKPTSRHNAPGTPFTMRKCRPKLVAPAGTARLLKHAEPAYDIFPVGSNEPASA